MSFELEENVPLAPLTTLGVGGPARYFARAVSEDDVVAAVDLARQQGLNLFVLGGGSNVLVSDQGFDGLVLQIALKGVNSSEFRVPSSESQTTLNSELGTRNSKLITVGAGEDWDKFVEHCVGENMAGVECLSGIPGSIGGTPVQNVGAYGQEVSETIISVRCFDRQIGKIIDLTNAQCGFTYRTSIFNSTARDRYIVLSVRFTLTPNGEPKLAYTDLVEYFDGQRPTLAEVRKAVLTIRRSKSMVIDPSDPNSRSAGSFFKNPIVGREKLLEIQARFADVPRFEMGGDKVKIPAAWLIENAGFHKGFALGRAGISANHTLALINRGGASANELLQLKAKIQSAVEAQFGIQITAEPVLVGY